MRIFDVHAHLQSDRFDADRGDVIRRAEEAGIERILNAATEPSDWNAVRSLGGISRFALGIHPWYIPDGAEEFLSTLTDSDFNGCSAIGEIGLDSLTKKTPVERQITVFEEQLSLAGALGLPCVIHCRGAFAELIRCASRVGTAHGAVIHAFNGSPELADDLMRRGFFLSFGGVLTFRDSRRREEMLRRAYPERFLLETDSPDIPVAERNGERGEPADILHVIRAASDMLGEPEERIAEAAWENALRLFGEAP